MVIGYQDYYKFVIIKAMCYQPRDNKMDKTMFMREGISQSKEESRNYPVNGAKTVDYPH